MPVHCLSIHADYACRHSGACCRAGWRIPAEATCEERLEASGLAARARTGGGPALERYGRQTVLALAPDGECAFFERDARPGRCAIHRVLGPGALPSACQHFPRVPVTDDGGTFVTLSHFCPTAAAMLFRDDCPLAIVEAQAAFHPVAPYDGLDARGVLPPLLRPGMLMDLEAHHAWQRRMVQVLAQPNHTAESALAQIGAEGEMIRTWSPGGQSLADRVGASSPELAHETALDDGSLACGAGRQPCNTPRAAAVTEVPALRELKLYDLARECVLEGLAWPPAPAELAHLDRELVEPAWRTYAAPVKRYLAARGFASWIPWSGGTVRTGVVALAAARAVLRVEATRQCGEAGRILDQGLLVEAIRRADLLLVHQVSAGAFSRGLLDLVEGSGPRPA